MDLYIAQAFGFLSFILGTYAFLQKDDKRLKIGLLGLFFVQSIHFFLMGSPSAVAVNILSFIRTLVSIKFTQTWLGIFFIYSQCYLGGFRI